MKIHGQKRFLILDPVRVGLVKRHRYCNKIKPLDRREIGLRQLPDSYHDIKDGRIQIPRWTADGKEKKVYINWDIYVLFNFVDKRKLSTQSKPFQMAHLKYDLT